MRFMGAGVYGQCSSDYFKAEMPQSRAVGTSLDIRRVTNMSDTCITDTIIPMFQVTIKRDSPSPAMREQMDNSITPEQKESELMTVFARIRGNQKLSNIEEEEECLR